MDETRRKRRDFIQNIVIVALSVSAVLLFTLMQLNNISSWQLRAAVRSSGIDSTFAQNDRLTAPVQVAITGSYGRFGSVASTTADDDFAPVRSLLGQALGSARTYASCGQEEVVQALHRTSVYCDFRASLPLTLLADLLWTSGGDESILARKFVVAELEGSVVLYLWSDEGTYLRCDTALSPNDLTDTVNQYELGNAQFAFDMTDSTLAPLSLFLKEEPSLPVLSKTAVQPDAEYLLTVLDFNPNTQNRYVDTSGTTVIRESERTLRIGTGGTISYQSGGDPTLSIEAASEMPTALEAVTGSAALLNTLRAPLAANASLFLTEVRQDDASTTLSFDYQVNGVPVYFSDELHAAEVTLSGTAISSITLRARQYTVTEEPSLLLPLQQAMAIAAPEGPAELTIAYADTGAAQTSAQWLVR